MALTKERKQNVMTTFETHAGDTGSAAVQIALLTERINQLTGHFKTHPKDFGSRRGLLKIVGQRRRLLSYVKKDDVAQYQQLIQKLNLRK